MTNILIVDDLEDNRIIAKSVIKNIKDVDIFEAEDGVEAIDIVQNNDIDIVLMDIMMPNMDGFEATKVIKKLKPEIMVIVITALDDKTTEGKISNIKIDGFFVKPIDYDLLKFKIQNFINFLQIKKNIKTIFTQKSAINPFSNDIRNMKIFYYIKNEDDMMDFGNWIMDYQSRHLTQATILSCTTVDFIYKIMIDSIHKGETLTIIMEDGFDNLYINIAIPKELDRDILSNSGILGDALVVKDGFIHLVLNLTNNNNYKDTTNNHKEPETKPIEFLNREVKLESYEERDDRVFIDFDSDDETKESVSIDAYDRNLLRQSHVDKVSAKEFVSQIEGSIIDEIHDLMEIEDYWQVLLDKLDLKVEEKILADISEILYKYSSVINSLYSFMALSYALSSLSTFVRNLNVSQLNGTNLKKFILLMSCVKSDLRDWRENIFEHQNSLDIHYLDSSLLSSCMQIESLLTNRLAEDEEESDLELF